MQWVNYLRNLILKSLKFLNASRNFCMLVGITQVVEGKVYPAVDLPFIERLTVQNFVSIGENS